MGSRTSSEGLRVCREPREEAPRVLLRFFLLLLVYPSLRGVFASFCPGWPEGAWSCMAFSSARTPGEEYSRHFVQVGRRVRGHAWPSPVPGRSARSIRVILSRLAGGCVVMHGLLQCQDARR